MRKLIATVFNYSLDGQLADEGAEDRLRRLQGLPARPGLQHRLGNPGELQYRRHR